MTPPWNEAEVRRWMQANRAAHVDPQTGELNCTGLAEAAAAEWDRDHEGGPIDDPDHWVWDLAVEARGASRQPTSRPGP